jgi:hypothetical protein
VIWLPLAQMLFPVIESAGLKGAFVPHTKPKLNDSMWFSGEFQKQYEQYLNDTIGFHQDLIRLRSQIDYSLFDKCHSYDVEVGKNGYLVATWHIDSHLGKVRCRETRIDSLVSMLNDLNDTLYKMNKTLLILFAPSRGSFYKELAPAWYDLRSVNESDYQRYTRLLAETKVNYIDFNKSFLEQKSKSKYPLFTKCGIHWSTYGAAVAADSIVKYIELIRNVDLPDMKFIEIKMSKKAQGDDADLNNALNLIWDVKNDPMAYPIIVFNKAKKDKLKLLTIGDSFYYGILKSNMPAEAFEEHSFWYYNNGISSNGPNAWKTTKDISFTDEITKHDVIALIATESTLINFGWGFIDQAWDAYCSPKAKVRLKYINKIKNDAAWFEQVKQKAKQTNKSIDQQLKEDADYVMSLEINN